MRRLTAWLLLIWGGLTTRIKAQHFQFVDAPPPQARHILSLFRFFAYTPEDPPPLSWDGSPIGLSSQEDLIDMGAAYFPSLFSKDNNNSTGVLPHLRLLDHFPRRSIIVFDKIKVDDGTNHHDMTSLQFAVLREADFKSFFDKASSSENTRLCCTASDVEEGYCTLSQEGSILFPKNVEPLAVVPLTSTVVSVVSAAIRETGVYVLLFANCGLESFNSQTKVNGAVFLRNYFGFLPGVEAPKVSVYLFVILVYVALVLSWGFQCVRHRDQLIQIHNSISAVIMIGLVESVLWFAFFRSWNSSPRRSDPFFATVIVVSVVKNITSFMLVLAACMGWGTTTPSLSTSTKRRMALTIALYTVFDSARQLMTQFRLAYQLPHLLVALCLLPVSVLHAIIFFWIFNSLAQLMEDLKAKKQDRKLRLFSRLYRALIGTLIAATFVLSAQIVVMSSSSSSWRQEWLFCDAAPVLFYIGVLCTVSWLWRPNRQSKAMAYSHQLPADDDLHEAEPDTAENMAAVELAEMEATYAAMGFSSGERAFN